MLISATGTATVVLVAVTVDEGACRKAGFLDGLERGKVVVAEADAEVEGAEGAVVAGADADVREVPVGRQREAEAGDVEVVPDRRTRGRVGGEVVRHVGAEAAAVGDEERFVQIAETGEREVARDVANPVLVSRGGVAEGQRAPAAGDEDFARGLTQRTALAANGVVGADGGTEGDAGVGLADGIEAHPDARDGAEVFVTLDGAVVVDVVAETQARVTEEGDALSRGNATDRQSGEGGGGEENFLHLDFLEFLFETYLKPGSFRIG